MTKDKDLKRLVRARMRKTGEAYTAARAHLTGNREKQNTAVPVARYAELAGMSDDAVRAKTGRTWQGWVRALDAAGAADLPHREIAAHLREAHELSAWWSQTVTVGYERIRGLRDVGQRRGGTYDANKSKTIAVPVETAYRAFATVRGRARWLADVELTARKATPPKSLRITWPDDTNVAVQFVAKGETKCQVTVQHGGLASRADVARVKAFWQEHLERLADVLVRDGAT